MQTSAEAKMFFDNIRYQNSLRTDVGPKWQSKDYKQIERYRRGLVMRLEEIQKQLEALGLNIPAGTLRRWASEGLIPNPKRYQNPEGRGWLSDWPDETLPEVLTVQILKDIQRLTNAEIAEARKAYYEGTRAPFSDAWGQYAEVLKKGYPYDEVQVYANEARQGFLNAEITLSHFRSKDKQKDAPNK